LRVLLHTSLLHVPRCGAHPALHSFPTRRSSDLSGNDTIDISSTITISWGRRFVRSRRKRLRPQVHPNRRWMVWGLTCSTVEATAASPVSRANSVMACPRRAAALPVGAQRPTRGNDSEPEAASATSIALTAYVLPVPGPPAITLIREVRAV